MNQAVTSQAAVLVVDDNPLIVNVLTSLLSADGLRVYSSPNGEEALELVNDKSVDVIICDVMMPKMDGYSFHEKIRCRPELAHIPFVFLSSLSESSDVMHGKEIGVDDYLAKPFDPRHLLAVVRGKVLRSRTLRRLSEERYEAYRRKIIHTLSHEFRTPLVAINTGTELLMEQKERFDAKKAKDLLEAIQRGGQRLEHLVNDFMVLQQIEAGIAKRVCESRKSKVEISSWLDDYVSGIKDELASQGVSISFTAINSDVLVDICVVQIEDILNRLVANSVKFSSEQKVIEVLLRTECDLVVVEVRDRGIGIDPDKLHEAIDIFGQIDRDRLEQQGGGLGLAIANRYAGLHGGRLEFERRVDGGSIVALVLPRIK